MKETAYLLQAAFISLWWVGLLASDRFFAVFQFPEIGPLAFKAFMIPDLALIAGLSLFRAYKASRPSELIILGGFAYASLYCINAAVLTKGGSLPVLLMVLGLFYNVFLCFQEKFFKKSHTNNSMINGLKTLVQIICIWTLTLGFIPYIILNSFGQTSMVDLKDSLIGIGVFVAFSCFGLWSSFVMVTVGKGTPLPLDQTNELVVQGPYRYVRNPMAVAGIGQGLALSLMFWSLPLVIYSLIGAIIWHVVIRPIEEDDLAKRFGEPYLRYKERVQCWVPTFRKPDTDA